MPFPEADAGNENRDTADHAGSPAASGVSVHALLDALPTFAGLLDLAGNITYVNATALNDAAATLAQVKGTPLGRTPWWSGVAAGDLREAIVRCAAGDACRLDATYRASATITVTVELHLSPILDGAGRVHAMVVFAFDVTGRAESQRKLLAAAERDAKTRVRTEQMFQLARALTGATDVATILRRTSRIGGELVGAAFANIGVADTQANEIELLHGASLDPEIGPQRWPRVALDRTTPIGAALLSGSPVELGRQDEITSRFPVGAADAVAAGFHSLAAYPIRRGRAAMGFAWTHPVNFDDELRHTLATIVDLVDLGLDRAEASGRDRRVAEQLQRSMLPVRLADVPGASVGALYEPGTWGLQVGGDWYDAVVAPEGRFMLGLGDVVGHGLQAASAMGQMRTAFAALAPTVALEDLVERLSRFSVGVTGAQFSTMAVAQYDSRCGDLRVILAGHVPPVIRRDNSIVEQLPDGGPPLGIDVGSGRSVFETVMGPGDTLVMYSDGLVERRGESIDVGLGRLAAALKMMNPTTGRLVGEILFDSLGRPHADDVAVLALVRASDR